MKFVKSETSPLQLRQRGKSFGQIVPNCSTFLRKFGIRLGAVINPQIISKKQTVCLLLNMLSPQMQIRQIDEAIRILKLQHHAVLSSIHRNAGAGQTDEVNRQKNINATSQKSEEAALIFQANSSRSCPQRLLQVPSQKPLIPSSISCSSLIGSRPTVAQIHFGPTSARSFSGPILPNIVVPHFEDFVSNDALTFGQLNSNSSLAKKTCLSRGREELGAQESESRNNCPAKRMRTA